MVRSILATFVSVAAGLFGFAAILGLTRSFVAAAAGGAALTALLFAAIRSGRLLDVDEAACPALLKIVGGVTALVAILLLTRLTIFMADPAKVSCSVVPSSQWEIEHSCLSAYYVAAGAVKTGNVYDTALYNASSDTGAGVRQALRLGPFKVDVFEYPPQFLLLAVTMRTIAPAFMDLRLLWFGFTGLVLLTGTTMVARAMGRAIGTRALVLAPLLWMAISTISTLQKGNVQIAVVAGAMIGMVLIARGHRISGGAILAFAVVSKLWPGLLVVYLVARRDWKAAGSVAAFAAFFTVLTLLIFGWPVYASFLQHAPGLLSGQAFPAFRNPAAIASNMSIPNFIFKLNRFGGFEATFGLAKVLGWIYTAFAVVVTVWAARRSRQATDQPIVWLAILVLATLRSPFLPATYGVVPPIWLLTLVAAAAAPRLRSVVLVGFGWLALNVFWPLDWPMDPRVMVLLFLVPLAATIAVTRHAFRTTRSRVTPAAVPGLAG